MEANEKKAAKAAFFIAWAPPAENYREAPPRRKPLKAW